MREAVDGELTSVSRRRAVGVTGTRAVVAGIDRLGQRLVERQQEQVECVGDARGLVGADVLQGRAAHNRAASAGHRSRSRSTRHRFSSISRQDGLARLIEDCPLFLQVAGRRCIGGPDDVALGVVEAGQGQRSASAARRSSRSGSFSRSTTERAAVHSDNRTGSLRATS